MLHNTNVADNNYLAISNLSFTCVFEIAFEDSTKTSFAEAIYITSTSEVYAYIIEG